MKFPATVAPHLEVGDLQPGQGTKKVESPKDCDWCCGAKRVTQKVAEAIQKLEPAT